jgi:GTPase SAR1 family protein
MSTSTGSYQRSSYYANQNMLVLNQLAALSTADNFMVVLCGIPGSGKSTYARRLVGGLPPDYRKMWVVANQDKLGSRQKVLSVAQSALRAKHNVIIDRCNFNPEQRSHWVELAQEQNISALIAVTMPEHVNLQLCVNRATIRGNSDGHGEDVNWNAVCRGMRNEYVMPTMAEGFSGVFQCSNEADLVCFANSVADIGSR